jgi:hypothetical protein
MASVPHAQRMNVLGRANNHGWTHKMAVYDDGNIIRDEFTSPLGVVRVVWLRTPWSDEGRWTGSLFSDKAAGKDRNVWKVSGSGGLLDLLGSLTSAAG